MNPRTDATPVGTVTVRAIATTRRSTPSQDRSPKDLCATAPAVTADASQGQPPADYRHANSTREHQIGGAPTRPAATRRGHPPRPPPHTRNRTPFPAPPPHHPFPDRRVKGASRRYAISLRLTLDPPIRPRFWQRSKQGRHWPAPETTPPVPSKTRHTTAMPYSHLTGPFHIRSWMNCVVLATQIIQDLKTAGPLHSGLRPLATFVQQAPWVAAGK
jgi:hypothetical protein